MSYRALYSVENGFEEFQKTNFVVLYEEGKFVSLLYCWKFEIATQVLTYSKLPSEKERREDSNKNGKITK